MANPYRITQTSSFGPTLETESLPIVGADRHRGRGRAWRRIFVALCGFWAVAVSAIAVGVLR